MYRQNAEALVFQTPVYLHARDLIVKLGICSILDVGCGNPQKLKAYIHPFVTDITGWDLPEVVDQIEETFGEWIGVDLDKDNIGAGRTFELIIIADVIEHLKNPVRMLEAIKRHADEDTIILISTPEKSSIKANNLSHEKEYAGAELVKLLNENNLNVEWSTSYEERNTVPSYISNVFVCKVKGEKDGK